MSNPWTNIPIAAFAVLALLGCDRAVDAGPTPADPETPVSPSAAAETAPPDEPQDGVPAPREDAVEAPQADPGLSLAASVPEPTQWSPRGAPSWQYHLAATPDLAVETDILVSDLVETTTGQVTAVHARGGRAVCYVSAGSWEDWRPDSADFPDAVLGADIDGWPGERWLDVSALDTLLPVMEKRVADCADKGFDGIEFDNVDGYTNNSGFPLTGAHQIAYNQALADLTHQYGLAAGLKNDVDQIVDLEPSFDFAINESCLEYGECETYAPFVAAGKLVLHVEYAQGLEFCSEPSIAPFSSIAKRDALDAWRMAC